MTGQLQPVSGDDDALAVRGGVGGIRFQWEELEEASVVLQILAADTGTAAVALGVIGGDVGELPWRFLHLEAAKGVGWSRYEEARADVDAARASTADNERELRTTEDRLRASVLAYRAADAVALAATEALRAATEVAARRAARAAIASGAVDVGPVELRHGRPEESVAFDGSVEGLLDRLTAVEADAPGSFEVLRAGSEEQPVYVVVLPGTQSGRIDGRPGSNPFDVGGIAEALTEDSRYTEESVRSALAAAGAEPGDGLIVAGYSQGGLHAVNLSGSGNLGSDYDVRLVLTVGTPSGWDAEGPGEYLHLEHRFDAVPRLDFTDNSDGRHRTTVSLRNPVPPLGAGADGVEESWGLGPAHKLENYVEGARLVDASDAPSLRPTAAVLAVAGASGTARRYSFTAVRTPVPAAGTATATRSRLRP